MFLSAVAVIQSRMIVSGCLSSCLSIGSLTRGRHAFQYCLAAVMTRPKFLALRPYLVWMDECYRDGTYTMKLWVPGYKVDTWVQSGHLGTKWTPGYKVDTWVQSGHLGTKWTPGYKVDTWVQSGHLGTKWTPGYKVDTWVQSGKGFTSKEVILDLCQVFQCSNSCRVVDTIRPHNLEQTDQQNGRLVVSYSVTLSLLVD